MYQDNLLTVSQAQALTGTALSNNSIDLGAAFVSGAPTPDVSIGEPVGFVIAIGVTANTATGDETYEFDLVQADTGDLGTNQLTIIKYPITAANAPTVMVAGKILVLPLPPGSITQRYIGINYVLGGTSPTVTLTAFLQQLSMITRHAYYPAASIIQ